MRKKIISHDLKNLFRRFPYFSRPQKREEKQAAKKGNRIGLDDAFLPRSRVGAAKKNFEKGAQKRNVSSNSSTDFVASWLKKNSPD